MKSWNGTYVHESEGHLANESTNETPEGAGF